jgi:NAD(P)-dependent dehydrogenase (short-subunit alcohol dehydrogenase family)
MTSFKELANLTNRTALITGATGHLGNVFSDTLAELGADLILVDLSESKLERLSSDLRKKWGIRVDHFVCDLEIQEERTKLITKFIDSKVELNILVNNAAFTGGSELQGWNVSFENQSIDTWRRAIEVNLTAVFDLSQGLLPLLRKSQGANIINISSIYGLYAPDWKLYEDTNLSNPAAYAVSKSGVIGFSRWLSTTISPEVRVNVIAPGGIFRDQPEDFVSKYCLKVPLGRMATEDDFRGALSYLASDLSAYMTGQIIVVDGGWGI